MDIFGIGTSEILFIIIIALIILGPKDLQKTGRTIGRWLRSIVTSDGWKVFQQTSRELKTLPNRLMRDANEELNQVGSELKDATNLADKKLHGSFASQPFKSSPVTISSPENKIEPPAAAEVKANESDSKIDA